MKDKSINRIFVFDNREKHILRQARRNKEIIYGGQSVNKQVGIFRRDTSDYDIYSKNPLKSARQLERTLDRKSKGDFYFSKPALHKGTHKVVYIGADNKRETRDDIAIADYTKPDRKIPFKVIDRVRYDTLSNELRNRRKSLRDEEMSFRHDKDKLDIARIKTSEDFRRKRR